MSTKKKTAKKGQEDEDTSTRDLFSHYKNQCIPEHVPISKSLVTKMTEALEEDTDLFEILISDEVGEFGIRAIANSLIASKYLIKQKRARLQTL